MQAAPRDHVLDLEWITAQLEGRREALPIEIALHIATSSVRSTIAAIHELGPLAEIQLADIVIDPRGRVLLHARRGSCSEDDLIRSLGVVLFSLLAGERPRGRVSTPLGLLAEEGVSESVIRIVARAVARTLGSRHHTLDELLRDLEQWISVHRVHVADKTVAELLRRNRLLEHARPLRPREHSSPGQWFRAPMI
jgi:hypothetical protein